MIKQFTLLVFLITGLGFSSCGPQKSTPCPDSNCEDYKTQQEAQDAFEADPDCRGDLDADNDRIACEQFTYSGNSGGCPTTSNCGCSGKNKSDCGGPCCKWKTGNACECS